LTTLPSSATRSLKKSFLAGISKPMTCTSQVPASGVATVTTSGESSVAPSWFTSLLGLTRTMSRSLVGYEPQSSFQERRNSASVTPAGTEMGNVNTSPVRIFPAFVRPRSGISVEATETLADTRPAFVQSPLTVIRSRPGSGSSMMKTPPVVNVNSR